MSDRSAEYAADVAAGVLESYGIPLPKSSEIAAAVIEGLTRADAVVGMCGTEAGYCVCASPRGHRIGHVCGDCGQWPDGGAS